LTWRLLRGWRAGDEWLLPALRQCFTWDGDRATGWLYLADRPPVTPWPGPFTVLGPRLLAGLAADTGEAFTACCFQGYRDGAGVGWHADRDWGAQAVLSLGVTRGFGLRRDGERVLLRLAHGDLLFMPPGFQDEWEHGVPVEDAQGERCSLVFRSPNRP
jgi:alkylated DNA repair dioxygenase AlkB